MADTIHAPATAPGKAGVAIVRVSGPSADAVCERLCGRQFDFRHATLATIRGADGEAIDSGIVLRFETGASFTGEPVVEFQVHGGPAIVDAVVGAIEATGLSQLAEPGAFTRRALENGRMDLLQVHGLADAIEAETELQRISAMRRMSGERSVQVRAWRDGLIHVASRLEAVIDFADEELPTDIEEGLLERVRQIRHALESELVGFGAARALRDGFEVAIVGLPNVGKSSLINYLSGREAAIVSDRAGTTRDVIEVRIDIEGIPIRVLDMAGLRDTVDDVERIGVERAHSRAASADLRLVLTDDGHTPDVDMSPDDLVLRTKADLSGQDGISTVTGAGIGDVLAHIGAALRKRVRLANTITRTYERDALTGAVEALRRCDEQFDARQIELVLDDIYTGIRSLRLVIGEVDVEIILDEIFSSFCLGK